MRTFTQLMFESILQIGLQIWMLNYFSDRPDQIDEFGVATYQILISLALATIHAVLEGTQLWLEARASRTTLGQYSEVCFNGKFSYVPFMNIMMEYADKKQAELESLEH